MIKNLSPAMFQFLFQIGVQFHVVIAFIRLNHTQLMSTHVTAQFNGTPKDVPQKGDTETVLGNRFDLGRDHHARLKR